LRDELINLIKTWASIPNSIDEHTSLIASGLLDSAALFNLILWIEEKTGRSIDPTSVDVTAEWDSIASILQYIQNSTKVRQISSKAISAANSDYRIVRYNSEFKRAVAEFQTGLWGPDAGLNRRYLEWKYEQNPYANEGRIFLAFHRDLLVGMRGFYGSRWEAGVPSSPMTVLVADDLLIREDHRNRGLVNQIMQAAFEDLRDSGSRFVFNLSGSKLTVLNSLAMNWKSIGTLRPMIRRSVGFLSSLKERLSGEQSAFTRLDRLAHACAPPRTDAMARLIQRLGHDGRLRHVRDQAYLDWRFGNPFREYRFLYAGDTELEGYLVLKRSVNCYEPQRLSIVDFEAVNERVQSTLLKSAVAAGAFPELTVWTSTADNQTLKQLRAHKFEQPDSRPAAIIPTFLVRPINLELPETEWGLGGRRLLEQSNWDIRMLYSMSG